LHFGGIKMNKLQVIKCSTNDFSIFSDSFETSDGVKREEEAQLKNIGSENESLAVRGSFSFVGDDGQTYTVDFIADENGYQPSGAHLPTV
jgi:Insect cuticle protein